MADAWTPETEAIVTFAIGNVMDFTLHERLPNVLAGRVLAALANAGLLVDPSWATREEFSADPPIHSRRYVTTAGPMPDIICKVRDPEQEMRNYVRGIRKRVVRRTVYFGPWEEVPDGSNP